MPTNTPNYNFTLPSINDPVDEDIWGGYLNSNFTILDTKLKEVDDNSSMAVNGIIPIGSVIPFAGSVAPDNYELCSGQALNRVTYADLFAIIGTTYGSGDGSTTFNVPDLRGRVVAGKDNMGGAVAGRLTGTTGGVTGTDLGASGGSQQHTLSIAEMPSHTHNCSQGNSGFSGTLFLGTSNSIGTLVTSSTGGGSPHNNVQPTLILNYIIKAK